MQKADYMLMGVAGSVIAYDILNPEKTLSTRIAEYREHSPGKMAVIGSLALLGAHLSGALPERYDPLSIIFEQTWRKYG